MPVNMDKLVSLDRAKEIKTTENGMIATVEASSTASKAYAVGNYFYYTGKLYKTTAPIASGGTITPGTNCTLAKLGDDVGDLKSAVNEKITNGVQTVVSRNCAFMDLTFDGSATDNILDPALIKYGKAIDANGEVVDAPDSFVSPLFEITKRYITQTRVFTDGTSSIKGRFAFYDSTKTFISRTGVSTNSPYDTSAVTGAAYFRINGAVDSVKVIDYVFLGLSDSSTIMTPVEYEPGEVTSAIIKKEYLPEYNNKTVDLFLVMGQSNIAGRGETSETWPQTTLAVDAGAGWEFRPISDPTTLYEIDETVRAFGYAENKESYINDHTDKTGGPVPAFINAYYKTVGVPVVGVSASQGGVAIEYFLPNAKRYQDARDRWNLAIQWLTDNDYVIRHKYILWCQGESDAETPMSAADYKTNMQTLLSTWKALGAEKIFVIRIGEKNVATTPNPYDYMIDAQTEICQTVEDIILVSTAFASMKADGLMKDSLHYYQEGYNIAGKQAGENTAYYVLTGKEPVMFDKFNNNLYYTHKN